MSKLKHITFTFLFLTFFIGSAQNIKDSLLTIPLLSFHASYQVPFGDMAKTFGNSANVGVSYVLKTKKNNTFGIEGSYFFGSNLKLNPLKSFLDVDNKYVNIDGNLQKLQMQERGFNFALTVGHIFNKYERNKNSGPFISAGAGLMQHKIHFYNPSNKILQITQNYYKGYDRNSIGLLLTQFLGYQHLSSNRFLNFYAGFEFYEGFTKSIRKYNYDTNQADVKLKFDVLTGFRFGWTFTILRNVDKDYYMN